ncbi:MAG: hypothetical protein RR328_05335 [Bacteroidales bacterium]
MRKSRSRLSHFFYLKANEPITDNAVNALSEIYVCGAFQTPL